MNRPLPILDDVNAPYYEGTKAGELRLCHCKACDELFVFTHAWCPRCWSLELDYKVASGRGTIETFSVIHQAPYESWQEKVPYVLALVMLDEGIRMMSNIVDCSPDDVRIGMPVTVGFEDREGVMLPVFSPKSA